MPIKQQSSQSRGSLLIIPSLTGRLLSPSRAPEHWLERESLPDSRAFHYSEIKIARFDLFGQAGKQVSLAQAETGAQHSWEFEGRRDQHIGKREGSLPDTPVLLVL